MRIVFGGFINILEKRFCYPEISFYLLSAESQPKKTPQTSKENKEKQDKLRADSD